MGPDHTACGRRIEIVRPRIGRHQTGRGHETCVCRNGTAHRLAKRTLSEKPSNHYNSNEQREPLLRTGSGRGTAVATQAAPLDRSVCAQIWLPALGQEAHGSP
jgi:hypothetical protein